MDRRGFLGSILAAGVAPWVVKSGVLMPVRKIVVVDVCDWFCVVENDVIVAVKREILSRDVPAEIFAKFGLVNKMPKNNFDAVTIVHRRDLPYAQRNGKSWML